MKNKNYLIRKKQCTNDLPPFLMVRSGLLNGWLGTVATTALATGRMCFAQDVKNEFLLADITLAIALFITICYGAISTQRKRNLFNQDIENIKNEFTMYMKYENYPLDLVGTINSPRLAKILIEHIVKCNPGVFDKMIQNPDSVMDPETQSNIISGYLKKHPDAACKIINAFKANEIDPKVYNKALKYSNRLRDYEKHR